MKLKKMIINNTLGIFKYIAVRPVEYCELFGINQLSACDRDGSYDSYDFVGDINEVNEYEKHWCSQGTNGFRMVAIRINRGFKNQSSIIYV